MQQPQPEPVTLDDILITEELSRRSPRPPNLLAENQALHTLARQLVNQPETILQTLVDILLDLCSAGTAGVSLLETTPNGEEIFRWNVLAGTLAQYVGGTTPRNFNPCGVCLEHGTPVLYEYPERYFTYLQAANTPIVEALVLPLIADNHSLGTIWIMSHDQERHFDSEDVRVMTSLADFTAAALLTQRQTHQLLVGHTIFEVLPPEVAASYEVLYRKALAGEPFEHEHNAHVRCYISRGTPLRSANGEVYAVLAISYDITDRAGRTLRERKRIEADAAADLEDTQRLRELSARLVAEDDIQTLYQEIVATAIALTRADAGTIQILDEATQDFLVLAAQGFEQTMIDRFYRVKADSNTSCGMAMATGDRAFIDFDVPQSEDSDGDLRLHLEAGYITAQSTPLTSRSGKTIGMVSTHWRNHHRPTERELRFLDLLARQAADLIEQRQAQVVLRESEEKYRTLFETMDEGFALCQLLRDRGGKAIDYRVLEINPAYERHTGTIAAEVVGRLRSEFDPVPNERTLELCAHVVDTGEPVRFDYFNEGLNRWLNVGLFPRSGNQFAAVFTNITDRKRAEKALRETQERQAFLLKLADALRPLADPVEIQSEAARVIGEHLGAGRAAYAEIDTDDAHFTVHRDYTDGVPSFAGRHRLDSYGPEFWADLRAGRTISVADAERDARISEAERAPYAVGMVRAAIGVPLVKGGRLAVVFFLHFPVPHEWTADEVALVEETAERTWAAVERARAEEALRMNEKRTRIQKEAFQSAINGEPLASSLNILTRIVKEQLGSDVRTAFYLAYPDGASLYAIDGAGDMPQTYTVPVDGFPIGEESFCSGYAIATGRPALTRDVSEDPVWQPYLHLASAHNFRSCGSYPILTHEGKAIGSFAMYFTQVHEATPQESAVADAVTQAAAIILSRHTQALERARAEEALRESEVKYRSLFESIDAGFCIFEMLYNDAGEAIDFRYIETNPAFERQSGRKPQPGQTMRELFPEAEDMWLKDYAEVARTGQAKRFIDLHQELDRWFDVFVFSTSNGKHQLAALFSDVTEEKRAEAALRASEERQAFLLKLSDILQRFVQPNDIKAAAMRLLGEHLGVSRAQYHECDSSGEYYDADGIGYANGVPLLKQKYRIDDFGTFVNEDFAAGRPYRIDDLAVDPRISAEERDAYRTYQIRAGAGVPLLRGGKLVAILAIHDVHPHQWTDLEMDLIRETAERIWTPVERARAKVAMRQSEAKYRTLFASIDEGFVLAEVIYDPSGQPVDILYLEANPAASRLTGVPDYTQRRMSEILPNMEPYWVELYDRVARTGVSERTEQYVAPLDRWYDFYVFRVEAAETSESQRVAIIFQDITDRKRTEAQLRRAAETDAFRVKLSDALRPLSDPVQIQAQACRLLGEHLGVSRAYYCEVNPDGTHVTVAANYTNGVPSTVGQYRLDDYSPVFRDNFRVGQNVVIADALNGPFVPEEMRAGWQALGTQACVCVPLVKEGRFVACMTVDQSIPRQWKDDEIELLEEVAERTWAAVERERVETALHESELQRIREQAAREEERQRAESLAELDRAKTIFFSNVSHEFRTPLTLLLAPLQDALNDCTLPPVHRERLELAHRNSLRLLKLVNTLLDFSRIEAGRMEAVYEPTDLAMFTTELASVFRSAIERAGLRLIVDCPPLPEPVYVDRQMWEKIVLNLLSNAFKFTLEGFIAVRLHLAENNQVILEIQDTGTGIAPEHLPHLFERFYQVRGVQARTHEGSGIGLAVVHELIQLHGGAIAVSSTVGQGTCFTITLPFGTDHLRSDRLRLDVGDSPSETLRESITATRTQASTAIDATAYVEEAERWLPADSDPPQPPLIRGENSLKVPLKREENLLKVPLLKGDLGGSPGLRTESTKSAPHILLVDDNADMREYLTRILSEHLHVEAFADGASALAAVQERVPDLVLTDVMMPGLDGFELLKALRTNPRTREVPIILLSARAGEEAVIEGLEAGADDYLIKPFSAQELVSRVNGHLQMAQLRLEALYQERTLNRRKDELLSTVSHELNTPLVAILGWTRLLRANPSNQSMLMKSLETIERNATLQAKLIQDLLDISRITAGKLRVSLEPVELESVIENAIASIGHLAQAKQIDLVWWGVTGQQSNTLAPGNVDRVLVQGDHERLQQIITNLLTNAIKFTPDQGSINVELSVIERHNGSDASIAEISITDTGIGICAEFLPHVFDRFRQAQESNSSKGLGLGLAIARHLVELHNGTIHAESAGVGQGATFIVRLPLVKVQ